MYDSISRLTVSVYGAGTKYTAVYFIYCIVLAHFVWQVRPNRKKTAACVVSIMATGSYYYHANTLLLLFCGVHEAGKRPKTNTENKNYRGTYK